MCAAGKCQNVSSPLKHPLTPKSANGPSQRASWATRHLSLLASVCGVLQPPLRAFSSASRASSSGVAPPVTSVRISVRMLSLKYVWGEERGDICKQMPLESQSREVAHVGAKHSPCYVAPRPVSPHRADREVRIKAVEDHRELSVLCTFSIMAFLRREFYYWTFFLHKQRLLQHNVSWGISRQDSKTTPNQYLSVSRIDMQ